MAESIVSPAVWDCSARFLHYRSQDPSVALRLSRGNTLGFLAVTAPFRPLSRAGPSFSGLWFQLLIWVQDHLAANAKEMA